MIQDFLAIWGSISYETEWTVLGLTCIISKHSQVGTQYTCTELVWGNLGSGLPRPSGGRENDEPFKDS